MFSAFKLEHDQNGAFPYQLKYLNFDHFKKSFHTCPTIAEMYASSAFAL